MRLSFLLMSVSLVGLVLLGTGCAMAPPGMAPAGGVSPGCLFSDVTVPTWDYNSYQLNYAPKDYEIVGKVIGSGHVTSILGIISTGDNGYGALLKRAKRLGADDVINVRVDCRTSSILGMMYTSTDLTLYGTAIRWKKK